MLLIEVAFSKALHAQFVDDTNSQFASAIYQEATIYGNGLSFFDFNQDGWDDVSLADGNERPRFFQNVQGQLQEVDLGIGNPDLEQVIMMLWADYDNDRDQDLLITRDGAPIQLWNNNGLMEFVNVAEEAGIEQLYLKYWGAAFADYDHDGYLDLCFVKYYSSVFFPGDQYRSRLYHNNGDGTFTDVTDSAGFNLPPRTAFQPVFFDFNLDGWEDLILIIDRIQFPNEIFINNGDGTFTNASAITAFDFGICSMSGSVADFDRDLDEDVYISNGPNGNLLMRNESGVSFSEVGSEYGIETNQVCWGGVWIDYDNNSWEDLFIGSTYTAVTSLGNWFYINDHGNGFSDGSVISGIDALDVETYSAAKGDLNNDGFYDMIWNNIPETYSRLMMNTPNENHYLSVSLEGVFSNSNGIGTLLKCYAGGDVQQRYTCLGENYIGQDSGKEIFGLDSLSLVDSLVVEWNSGTVDVFHNIEVNRHLNIREGDSFIEVPHISFSGETLLCSGDSLLLDAGNFPEVFWNTGDTGRWLTVWDDGLYYADITDDFFNVIRTDSVEVVFDPLENLTISVTPATCHNSHDGSAELEVDPSLVTDVIWDDGDTGLFNYFWQSGIHSCVWIDNLGCTYEAGFEITAPSQMTLNIETTSVSCYGGNDAVVLVEVTSGGTPPYTTYCEMDCNHVFAGKHYATAIDANGCEQSYVYFVGQPDPLVGATHVENLDCNGDSTGMVSLEISGGIAPYQINWMGADTSALSPGDYAYEITDANGCLYSSGYSILPSESFDVEISVEPVTCFGDFDGVASAVFPEDVILDWDVEDTTAFGAGQHTLIATDANGCVQQYSFEIYEPEELICDVLVSPFIVGENTDAGSGIAIVSGGLPPYEYVWSNSFETDDSVFFYTSGQAYMFASDENGCSCISYFEADVIYGVDESIIGLTISSIPANDQLMIEWIHQQFDLDIYDAVGKIVLSRRGISQSIAMDVSNWSSGTYFLHVQNGEQRLLSKCLIQH